MEIGAGYANQGGHPKAMPSSIELYRRATDCHHHHPIGLTQHLVVKVDADHTIGAQLFGGFHQALHGGVASVRALGKPAHVMLLGR